MFMVTMTPNELSSIFGWISIACWIVVYSPQIWENYVLRSGEGLSVAFIVLWLIGDVTNLLGGALAGLLPTMLILASYYTICDIILLFQLYYYRRHPTPTPSEETPLLTPAPREVQERSFIATHLVYILAFALVVLTGLVAWGINVWGEGHNPLPIPEDGSGGKDQDKVEWKSQTLGWISAVTYIGSRVPQIYHNWQTRCAGLSLGMFLFTISGNLTYIASILFKSTRARYVEANLPWLIGSGLTIFLDIAVLGQFAYFSNQSILFPDLATLQAQAERVQLEHDAASEDA